MIGVAYQQTGTFVGPLIYVSVVALIGALSYSIVLGDIHRLDVHAERAPQLVGQAQENHGPVAHRDR